MASEPEVILHQMEATRTDLAEKLETLEKEVVDTVQGAAQAVTGTVENVKEAVEGTVENVKETVQETVDNVKETVQEAVASIRDTFDLNAQIHRHPWAMFSGSVFAGCALGCLVNRLTTRDTGSSWTAPSNASNGKHAFSDSARTGYDVHDSGSSSESSTSALSGAASSMMQAFGPEIERLKGLAIGTLAGVVRDIVVNAVPEQIKGSVCDVINRVTTKMGGEPVKEPLCEPSRSRQHATNAPEF